MMLLPLRRTHILKICLLILYGIESSNLETTVSQPLTTTETPAKPTQELNLAINYDTPLIYNFETNEFPPLTISGKQYLPQNIIEILSKNNPKQLQIKYNNNIYTPKQFLEKYGIIPTNFNIILANQILKPEDVTDHIPLQIKPDFPTINYNGLQYTPEDIIKLLSQNNPDDIKITYSFSPREFLKIFETEMPLNFTLESDGKVIQAENIASYITWPDYNKWIGQTVMVKGNNYTSQQIVDILVKNNPNNLSITIGEDIYKPDEFLKKYKVIPNYFNLMKDGKLLEDILDVVDNIIWPNTTINNTTNQFPSIILNGVKYNPNEVLELFAKYNPKNLLIEHNGGKYTPNKYLQKYSDAVPRNFHFVDNLSKQLTTYDVAMVIADDANYLKPSVDNTTEIWHSNDEETEIEHHFPRLKYKGDIYAPEQLLNILALNNPKKLSVMYKSKSYNPKEFLETFNPLPHDFFIVKDKAVLDNNDVAMNIPFPKRTKFRFRNIRKDGVRYVPQDIIEILSKDNPHNLIVSYNNQKYTPQQFLEKFKEVPKLFEIIKEGKAIEEIEVAKLIKNWPTDFSPKFPNVRHKDVIYTPQNIIEILATNNPYELSVRKEDETYWPEDFLRKYPTVPRSFDIIKDGLVLDEYEVENFIPWS